MISAELPKIKHPVRRNTLLAEAANLKTKITTLKAEQNETLMALTSLAAAIPNDTHPETASTETEVGKIGELREKTTIKDHVEIAESLLAMTEISDRADIHLTRSAPGSARFLDRPNAITGCEIHTSPSYPHEVIGSPVRSRFGPWSSLSRTSYTLSVPGSVQPGS